MVSLDHLEMKHRGHRAAPDLNILLPSQKERERDRGGQDEAGKGAKAQGHRQGNREVRAKPQAVQINPHSQLYFHLRIQDSRPRMLYFLIILYHLLFYKEGKK